MTQADWYGKRIIRGTGIAFIRGSYWWLKTKILRHLDWPDPRLQHNGGDTALSEAIWQLRKPQHSFFYGIVKELAPRRGRSEKPAGFKHNYVNRTDGSVALLLHQMGKYMSVLEGAEVQFLKLDDSTLLIDRTGKYIEIMRSQPLIDQLVQASKTTVQVLAPVKPAKHVIRRKRVRKTRRPASTPPPLKKTSSNVLNYLQVVKPAQPKPRAAPLPRQGAKTLKQLLQERRRKR